MLLEEAEKLYNKLAKELVDESISDYACSISSHHYHCYHHQRRTTKSSRQTTAAIQSNMHTAEHRFVQSEIDKEDQDS